jgi:hypothetical protein
MGGVGALVGIVAALAAGADAAGGADLLARASAGRLRVRLDLAREGHALAWTGELGGRSERAAAPCLPELCPPRVEVPGFTPRLARPSRTELFATLLDHAGIEPFATVAWLLVATGVRVDWSPPIADGPSSAAARGGWGTVSVRLRLRIDATNRPAMPARQRPARFSRT